MEDFFFVLVVIFFVIAPLLEKLTKGSRSRQPQQPQRRRSRPAPRPRLPDGRTTTLGGSGESSSESGSQDASDLLPADLWEVLTGQRPQPKPEPTRPPDRSEHSTVRETRDPQRPLPRRGQVASRTTRPLDEEAAAAELIRRRERTQSARRKSSRTGPSVVSLETEPASESARHHAFHDKLDRLAPAAVVEKQGAIDIGLDDVASLRHAILLQEVLGRPKGLD